jgi:hypothetical protein
VSTAVKDQARLHNQHLFASCCLRQTLNAPPPLHPQANPLLQLTSLLLATGEDSCSAGSGWLEEASTWRLLAQLAQLQRLQVPSLDACPDDCTLHKVRRWLASQPGSQLASPAS